MQLHFYTTLNNIREIENGNRAEVWIKTKAKASDIHISIENIEYRLYKTDVDNVFELQKRRTHTLQDLTREAMRNC